jgi:hypothetical protein
MSDAETPEPPHREDRPETLEENLRHWDELMKLEDADLFDRINELSKEKTEDNLPQ